MIKQNGMLVFVVHNPDYVRRCLEAGVLFSGFASQEHPTRGMINLGTGDISIFIRTATDYTEILQHVNFHNVLEEYPPFTAEFVSQYSKGTPTVVPEYLIMAFVK